MESGHFVTLPDFYQTFYWTSIGVQCILPDSSGLHLKQGELLIELFRLIVGIVTGVESGIKFLEVDVLVKNDQSPDGVCNWLEHLPALSFDNKVLKGFLACIHHFSFLCFTKVRVLEYPIFIISQMWCNSQD